MKAIKTLICSILLILLGYFGSSWVRSVLSDRLCSDRIELPHVMFRIIEGKLCESKPSPERALFLIILSRQECTPCAIEHLDYNYAPLLRLEEYTNAFDVTFVMSIPADKLDELVQNEVAPEYHCRVWFDTSGEMERYIPSEKDRALYLTDSDGVILYEGYPIIENRVDDKFFSAIKNL